MIHSLFDTLNAPTSHDNRSVSGADSLGIACNYSIACSSVTAWYQEIKAHNLLSAMLDVLLTSSAPK